MIPRPYDGRLIDLVLKGDGRDRAYIEITGMPTVTVNHELAGDIQIKATGVFSRLEGFMVREDFKSVLYNKRLASVANEKSCPHGENY